MARPNRHFKVGFNELYLSWGMKAKEEYTAVVGLFDFAVRGLKFSWDYVLDESPVEQLPNGTWTGIYGLLNRSEIDYAPVALRMTEERWEAAAYNYPYANGELVFMTKNPVNTPETMALFRTLSPNVWSSLLACILLVTLACFVAMKHRCTLGDILLHVLSIALNQEGNLVPRRTGEVLLLSTWLGAMAVFTFCFKSVLLSFLTFPPMGGVRTVPELAAAIRAGHYIAFTHPNNDFARYLQRSPNEDFRVIGESMLKHPYSAGHLLTNMILDPKYTAHQYPHYAYVNVRSRVDMAEMLYVSDDVMGSFNFATAVSKKFCCKEEMDMLVHRFMAAGIPERIKRLATHKNIVHLHIAIPPKYMTQPDPIRKLTMTDLSGAFILLAAGHCLSLCVLIVECWMKRRERRRLSPRTT